MTGIKKMKDIVREAIFDAIDKCGGNKTHAAAALGISIRAMRNKLNKYKREDSKYEANPTHADQGTPERLGCP